MTDQQNTNPAAYPSAASRDAGQSSGCLQGGMLTFMAIWILIATMIVQSVTWFMEQAILEGSFLIADTRWLMIGGYGLAIIVPSVLLWLAARHLPVRSFYLAFALAGLFTLLLAPARLLGISAAFETAAAQMIIIALYLLLDLLLFRRISVSRGTSWQNLGPALLVAGAVGIPWLLWGAVGSLANVLINLLAALLFGLAASRIIGRIFWPDSSTLTPTTQCRLFQGFAAFLVLLVMVSGMGMNGNQGLLTAAVPVLGWVLAVLASREPGLTGRSVRANWPVLALLVGLAVFWPLAFIDPDELAAAFSFGLFELVQWALLAAFVSLAIAMAASVVLALTRRWLNRAGMAWLLAAALVWGMGILAYFSLGQPGLYGDRLFVILAQQADLSHAAQIEDVVERRSFVYRSLVTQADTSQANLRAALNQWGIAYQPYYLENALEVDGGPLLRWWLERRPEVDRVVDSPVLRPLPAEIGQSVGSAALPQQVPWNLRMIGADRVWQELGVTGQGIVIGQSDTGVQADHPELADSYRGRSAGHDYNWLDPWYQQNVPYDLSGHGTHTLGSVLGNRVGVAPDAEWIGCVNLARNLGNPALYLDCMQFMLAPYPHGGDPFENGRPDLGAQITNNSWGCPEVEGCDPATLEAAVNALRAAGIFVVTSVGNDGFGGCETVTAPIALFDQVYSVGAIGEDGSLASFSSMGPVTLDGSGRVKPDIAAPGVDILSAYPGSSYSIASGTSMAGPHVAGVVALMWSANPNLIGQIERTEQILNETAVQYTAALPDCVAPGRPNNGIGYGIVDAYQAVLRALEE
jgi:hypothetical protein